MNKGKRVGLAAVCAAFMVAEAILIIASWLLSATMTDGVRSLLSSEGIRWFFGSFSQMLASPLLVWLILLLIAFGSFQKSGAVGLLTSRVPLSYRDRLALRIAFAFLALLILVIALLTVVPHAILLSVTGELFPSPFSRSLVPVIAFGVCIFSVTFGVMSGKLRTLSDVLHALSFGVEKGASLFILYILAVQFFESLRFVFGDIG